jgi:hypothetical protein
MGKAIVTLMEAGTRETAHQWASKVFEQACVAGQREASKDLDLLDESLSVQCPVGGRW